MCAGIQELLRNHCLLQLTHSRFLYSLATSDDKAISLICNWSMPLWYTQIQEPSIYDTLARSELVFELVFWPGRNWYLTPWNCSLIKAKVWESWLVGYLSWRSHVWEDVDNERCGILPFVWDKDFGFDRYTEYALDVPMYFAYRDHQYLDATKSRVTFREFLEGKLPLLPGQSPQLPTSPKYINHTT